MIPYYHSATLSRFCRPPCLLHQSSFINAVSIYMMQGVVKFAEQAGGSVVWKQEVNDSIAGFVGACFDA